MLQETWEKGEWQPLFNIQLQFFLKKWKMDAKLMKALAVCEGDGDQSTEDSYNSWTVKSGKVGRYIYEY